MYSRFYDKKYFLFYTAVPDYRYIIFRVFTYMNHLQ